MRLLCILLVSTTMHAAEVVPAGRWELHNSFWMNLHQALMHDASPRSSRDLTALSPEERAVWTAAVAAYRDAAGEENITFADSMINMQDALSQVADGATSPSLSVRLAEVIQNAAPVYRTHWWPADQAANRFRIAYVAAMLRDAGEELAEAHATVFGQELPGRIRVDVTGWAGRFGAYTHTLKHAGTVVTMSSRDEGTHGVASLESVLHESLHAIVFPRHGRVGRAISAAAEKQGIAVPRDLWHAILFDTSSQLTVRALAKRGVTTYTPFSADLLTRAWPQYREPIEAHWRPYLDGKGTLEEAIERIVAAVR